MPLTLLFPPHEIPLTQPRLRVGRADSSDIRIASDPLVSSHHCLITHTTLIDQSSTNGTLINNNKIPHKQPIPLRAGDVITVGETNLFVVDRNTASPNVTSPLVGHAKSEPVSHATSPVHSPTLRSAATSPHHRRQSQTPIRSSAASTLNTNIARHHSSHGKVQSHRSSGHKEEHKQQSPNSFGISSTHKRSKLKMLKLDATTPAVQRIDTIDSLLRDGLSAGDIGDEDDSDEDNDNDKDARNVEGSPQRIDKNVKKRLNYSEPPSLLSDVDEERDMNSAKEVDAANEQHNCDNVIGEKDEDDADVDDSVRTGEVGENDIRDGASVFAKSPVPVNDELRDLRIHLAASDEKCALLERQLAHLTSKGNQNQQKVKLASYEQQLHSLEYQILYGDSLKDREIQSLKAQLKTLTDTGALTTPASSSSTSFKKSPENGRRSRRTLSLSASTREEADSSGNELKGIDPEEFVRVAATMTATMATVSALMDRIERCEREIEERENKMADSVMAAVESAQMRAHSEQSDVWLQTLQSYSDTVKLSHRHSHSLITDELSTMRADLVTSVTSTQQTLLDDVRAVKSAVVGLCKVHRVDEPTIQLTSDLAVTPVHALIVALLIVLICIVWATRH